MARVIGERNLITSNFYFHFDSYAWVVVIIPDTLVVALGSWDTGCFFFSTFTQKAASPREKT